MVDTFIANKVTHTLAFILGIIFGVVVFTQCVITYHDPIDIDCAITYVEHSNANELIRLNCKR